jgi:hypothetical protein
MKSGLFSFLIPFLLPKNIYIAPIYFNSLDDSPGADIFF